ncbi:L-type lectin-domain containing receptor kinase IX.1-like [Tripterygium wilfordii]|uniref:L-type lectin-domain containing receptor kinase IX.1-like n=1 Tax=Tripterygium wilfordii TaxID=458696 RepID=UPI0018F854D2|nr:L-type lectin-domain containing receptor kinase IX.1-like [Tripterygium wilfordii]
MDNSLLSCLLRSFCFLFLFFLPTAKSISFQINRFDPNDLSIIYEGDATTYVGVIDFTSELYFCHIGRATYSQKVPLWDPDTRKLADFNTHFSFTIDIEGRALHNYSAGLAFFIAPVGFSIPLNSADAYLGLYSTTTSGSSKNQIVHVEFDTFSNPEWDPPYEHIGINKNSIASAVTTFWNVTLHSNDNADVWITYNATTKNFSVSWTFQATNDPNENSSLSYIIDLMEVLPEWVSIGFSAATGYNMERHNLNSWEFHSSLNIKETRENQARTRRPIIRLAVSLVGALIAGVIIASAVLWKRKQKRMETEETTMNMTSFNEDLEREAGPRRFSYKDLASATKNFSSERKLGEGGFGAVYKGYLNDLSIPVAVKKISRGSKQGKREYITEIRVISRLRHPNLVQLIGWCHDKHEFLLVYEFMPNRSLDSHLFGKKPPLTWVLRYKIALGIASGLLYLHEEWEQCVVHRDIRSSNIMLDSSFIVKLGDFGLARLIDHEVSLMSTGLAGTFGYMAPEYVCTGRASKESDVYSFGVVILEIATGRKATNIIENNSRFALVEWIWSHYGRGDLLLAIDERLHGGGFDDKQVQYLMIVGLCCAHPNHRLRPSMRQAIQVLNFEAPLPDLPMQMPALAYHAHPQSSPTSTDGLLTSYSSLEYGR